METKTKLGTVINEKLNSIEHIPAEHVWKNIALELDKKKQRRIALFWLWSTPLLTALGLFLLALYFNYTENSSADQHKFSTTLLLTDSLNKHSGEKQTKTKSQEIDLEATNRSPKKKELVLNKIKVENDHLDLKKSSNKNKIATKIEKNKSKVALHNNKKKYSYKKSTTNKYSTQENLVLKEQGFKNQADKNSIQTLETIAEKLSFTAKDSSAKSKQSIKKIKMFPEDLPTKDSLLTYKKFDIDVYAAPTIYSAFSNKSSLDSRLNTGSKKSEITLSYGLGLTVNVTEKIGVRLGYELTNFNLTTLNAETNTTNYSFIDYNKNTSNQTIYTNSGNSERMDIQQTISYGSIPLELRYKFIGNKFGLTGIGGISYLYLSKNEISIQTNNGFSQPIGKTSNLSKVALSASIGVGLDYQLNQRLRVIVEPIFDYQLKTFEKSSSIQPFSFSMRTGLRYNFNK